MNRTQPIGDREFLRWIQSPDHVCLLGMLNPRRPGVLLFTVRLEYLHYAPGTERNDLFEFVMNEWNSMTWAAIRIPKREMEIARKVAQETGLRIADGVPVLMHGQILATSRNAIEGVQAEYLVPPEASKNVFVLENANGHPIYSRPQEVIFQAEDKEVARITAGAKNTN